MFERQSKTSRRKPEINIAPLVRVKKGAVVRKASKEKIPLKMQLKMLLERKVEHLR
jgi:hypothetical protein